MKYTLYLDKDQVADLEFEVISTSLRVHLTRLLSKISKEWEVGIIQQNKLINISRNLKELPIYLLTGDENDGSFHPAEFAWHNGEFELLLRRFNTLEAIEFLGFLIEENYLGIKMLTLFLYKMERPFTSIQIQITSEFMFLH